VKKFFKFVIWCSLVVLFLGACVGGYFWYMWSSNMPYIGSVKEYHPPLSTQVYSRNGEVIGRFWEEKRIDLVRGWVRSVDVEGKSLALRGGSSLRYDKLEQEVQAVAAAFDEVKSIEVRPGAGYGRPSRTLLVDDEREYVMTLSERLEMRDIPADIAYDGEEALTFVNTEAPDVMVLDLRMPGMDGLEVLRRIKRDHPSVEVIIVTGHGTETDERIARELGAFDYLKKPVDIKVLAQRIKEASQKARGERGEELEQDDD